MLRRFLIIGNALIFGWVQTAFAMKADQVDSAYQFLRESGVTQHDVTVKEMYEKFGNTLPEPIRLQMEHFAKENPNYTIPKMDVKKVKVKGEDQLQFNLNSGRGSIVVTTQGSKDVFATVLGSYDGIKIQTEVKYDFFLGGHKVVYEARKDMMNKKVHYLTGEELNKLKPEEQKEYIKHLREILLSAETVQEALHVQQNKSASLFEKLFRDALVGEAWAAGESCVFGGWTDGVWKSGKDKHAMCTPPAEAKCSGGYSCNPQLYGEGLCIEKALTGRQFTEECNKRDSNFKNFAASNVNGKRETLKDLNEFLGQLSDICNNDSVSKVADQAKACSDYRYRVTELKKICEKDNFKNTATCKTARDPVPVPTPVGVVNPNVPNCKDLADNESKLTVGNCEKNDNQVVCGDKKYNYCSACKTGFNGYNTGSVPVTKCEKVAEQKQSSGKDGKNGSSGKDGKDSKSFLSGIGDWFSSNSSWLVPTGLIFLMMYLGFKSQQQMIQAQAQPYIQAQQTYVPPVASTPLSTTNPVLTTPNAGAR